ncbi:MAG: hypothetical protein IPH20_04785 [Bacteroidales bacterium]|nr:hypothetical protein [Bacteroidales bacterium]
MKTILRHLGILALILAYTPKVSSQGVMISNDPAAPQPSALLQTFGLGTGDGNILFMGEWKGTPGPVPALNAGTRMMWYPDKSAFRAGRVTSAQWNTENIGNYSSATGFNTTASGSFANAWGSVTTASGAQSTAWGFNNIASGTSSTAWGENTTAPSFAETVFGFNNTVYTPASTTAWVAGDRLFVIGNGSAGNSDALVMLKNGNTGLGTSSPTQRLEVAGSIYGQSSNWAIRGVKTGTTGTFPGVWGETESASANANGIRGFANNTTSGSGSAGVFGKNFGTANTNYGVLGEAVSVLGRGVYGYASSTAGTNYGVYGRTESPEGFGVYGINAAPQSNGSTVIGAQFEVNALSGVALRAIANSTGSSSFGIIGRVYSQFGTAVFGDSDASTGGGYGIWGNSSAPGGLAGYFSGDVFVSGSFSASGTKSFVIDHPHDPANKYLYHYNLESPEPYNLYQGTITLDESGSVWVSLPDYFDAINKDFSYQLTAIGASMPNLHIANTIKGNRFQISGGVAGKQVSWQVTALRNDSEVRENGFLTETEKPEREKGTYLHPEGFGQPKELQRDYQRINEVRKEVPRSSHD